MIMLINNCIDKQIKTDFQTGNNYYIAKLHFSKCARENWLASWLELFLFSNGGHTEINLKSRGSSLFLTEKIWDSNLNTFGVSDQKIKNLANKTKSVILTFKKIWDSHTNKK